MKFAICDLRLPIERGWSAVAGLFSTPHASNHIEHTK